MTPGYLAFSYLAGKKKKTHNACVLPLHIAAVSSPSSFLSVPRVHIDKDRNVLWVRYHVVESTMSAIVTSLDYPDPQQWVVCCSDAQTKGRGTNGRVWSSPPGGNIYMTIAIPEKDLTAHGCTAVLWATAALAVRECIVEYLPATASTLRLKWPNDILLGGSKVGGILIEFKNPGYYLIGVGINVCTMPSDPNRQLRRPAAKLIPCVGPIASQDIVHALQDSLVASLRAWVHHQQQTVAGTLLEYSKWLDLGIVYYPRPDTPYEGFEAPLPHGTLIRPQGIDELGGLIYTVEFPASTPEEVRARNQGKICVSYCTYFD